MKLKPTDVSKYPGFIRWWAIYPRKVAKGAALRSWVDLDGEAIASDIIKGTKNYTFSEEVRFIPHPSTFLNQWRFLDSNETPQHSEDQW